MSINFEEDAAVAVTQEDLKEISTLAKQMMMLELRIKYHQTIIESIKDDYNNIQLKELPELMKRCQMQKFTLANGVEVGVKSDLSVGITEKNKLTAFDWLEKHDGASIIKSTVEFFFDRNDEELRKKFLTAINKTPWKDLASQKSAVHAQTLKAWFREYLEQHGELDEDTAKLFGLYQYDKATLKIPKDVVI